jgi:hypothetical protein
VTRKLSCLGKLCAAVDRFQASKEGQDLFRSMEKKGIIGLLPAQRHEAVVSQRVQHSTDASMNCTRALTC